MSMTQIGLKAITKNTFKTYILDNLNELKKHFLLRNLDYEITEASDNTFLLGGITFSYTFIKIEAYRLCSFYYEKDFKKVVLVQYSWNVKTSNLEEQLHPIAWEKHEIL